MKFYNYINEKKTKKQRQAEINEIWDIIQKDCAKIIDAYKKAGNLLYRAIGNPPKDIFFERKRISTRTPLHTEKAIHDHFNQSFKDKFGWKARNGVFAKSGGVDKYGATYIFFPIGKFDFVWSPGIDDLYKHLPPMPQIIKAGKRKDKDSWVNKKKSTFNKIINTYESDNLVRAIRSGHEVSFKVSRYYMLKANYEYQKLIKEKIGI